METTQIPEQTEVQKRTEALPKSKEKKKLPALKLPKKQKKWLRAAVLVVIAGAGVYWFTHRAPSGMAAGPAYVPETVQRRDLTVSVSGTGTITPIDSYEVRSLTTGEVLESPFEEGDLVEKGALLYRMDAQDAETAIQQAMAGVEQAQRSVEQAERGVEQAKKSVTQAEKGVSQAEKNYDDYVRSLTVRAPEAGVVQKVLVQRGEMLSAGSPVAEIADTSVLKLSLPFHSTDAQKITVGQSAQVTIAGTLETLPAVVDSVAEADLPGAGGTLVRRVTLRLDNPGVLTAANSATATVGGVACAGSGSFEEVMRRTVTAQTTGQVTELPIAVGSRVSEGSSLAVLGGTTVQNSLDELERAEDAARDGVTAAQDSVTTAQDGVSAAQEGVSTARDAAENAQITLQNAQLALENAQRTLQNARDALDHYTITAPISGVVIEKKVKAGDKVDGIESGSLAVIYDLSYLKLEMDISELDLNQIQPGQTVEITADALPGQVFQGVLEKVSINGTTTNGFTTYPATILLEDYGGLNPGMNVSADIVVERVEQVLSVPAAAIQRGDAVLVALEGCLAEDGVTIADPTLVEERTVTLGGSDGVYVEITSGLSEGDVVLAPAQEMGG